MTNAQAHLLERLARVLHNDAHAGGLKPTQWEALRYLGRANRFSCSPGALTAYLGVTKGTVSQTLQALERKGLVKKAEADGDRRGVKLDLTKAGEKVLGADPLGDLEASIAAMPRAARSALGGHLQALVKDMLDRRGGRAFGACKTCRHFRRSHAQGAPHFCSLLSEPCPGTIAIKSAPNRKRHRARQGAAGVVTSFSGRKWSGRCAPNVKNKPIKTMV